MSWRLFASVLIAVAATVLPSVGPAEAVVPPARAGAWPADAMPGSLLVTTDDGHTTVVRVAPGAEAAAAARYRQRPHVVAVEADHLRHTLQVPNDPLYAQQWAHNLAHAPAAWDTTTGSAGVRVAVIDTGVDATHPDLAGNVVAQADASSGTVRTVPRGTNNDPCNDQHGTFVAGVVGAAGNNAAGVAGVAWRTSIVDIAASDRSRCGGSFADSALIAAILWAADPAGGDVDVINLSVGSPGDTCPFAYKGAVDFARSKGVTVVAAAGNSQQDLPGVPSIPASCEGVLSAGAVGQNGTHSVYSTANPYVDVAAPGGDSQSGNGRILSTVSGGGYGLLEGTSFASPYIAGTVALMKSVRPALTPDEAARILEGTTQSGGAAHSWEYGWGLVDVGAAVQAAASGAIPPAKANASLPSAAVLRLSAPTPATVPIQQAVAISQYAFRDATAGQVVLARPDNFADALGGSSLAYGIGPVLYTPSTGGLDPSTESEIQRVLPPGGRVYVLGGTAAIPAGVDDRLRALGFEVVRLAGQNRMDTARIVAGEVVERIAELGFPAPDRVVLVTALDWPDAVTAGSFGALFGDPILLTTPDALSPEAAAALQALQPSEVDVVGGTAVVSDAVANAAGSAASAPLRRIAGTDRDRTAIAVAQELQRRLNALGFDVVRVVAVNLRRADGFSHVLAATALTGSGLGVFLPIAGDGGTIVPAVTAQYACQLDPYYGIVIGGADVIADSAKQHLNDLLTRTAC